MLIVFSLYVNKDFNDLETFLKILGHEKVMNNFNNPRFLCKACRDKIDTIWFTSENERMTVSKSAQHLLHSYFFTFLIKRPRGHQDF